ncbi:MAG: helicase-related protein [Candidatus Micrarchaeota archaeon]|nr:helicase-related protein [Candidatus Micrarchaeota archaeon]
MEGFSLTSAIAPRAYQLAIANSALRNGNTLVVLPTGLGKTLIAFLVMQQCAKRGRIFFLAPTKPLVRQHQQTFLSQTDFPAEKTALITGEISPKKRVELWQRQVCFSTPQTLQNDILAGRTDASSSLCIIDEAHRAVGKYAYTFVAQRCFQAGALIVGLTASPGGNRQRIQQIVDALGIQNIEIRTAEDSDVAPYIKPLEISYVRVPLGQRFLEVRRQLSLMLSDNVRWLSSLGFHAPTKSKKGLVELRAKILRASERIKYPALSYYTTIFNLVHMLELIETQGLATFLSYVEKLRARKDTKAKRRIFNDERFKIALELCESAAEHPKLEKLLEVLAQRRGQKLLVFSQYRKQVETIVEALRKNGWKAERFLGKKEGVTAEEQRHTIDRFKNGEFDVMVATSIGEEGLDIPSVDTVVFFEPIPSEIRSIQRRGRAGRLKAGSVVILITAGTRDEASFYSSRKKEENMRRIVGRMKQQFSGTAAAKPDSKASQAGESQQPSKPQKPQHPGRKKGSFSQSRLTDF